VCSTLRCLSGISLERQNSVVATTLKTVQQVFGLKDMSLERHNSATTLKTVQLVFGLMDMSLERQNSATTVKTVQLVFGLKI